MSEGAAAGRPSPRRAYLVALAVLTLATALWGSNSVAARLMVTNMPPLSAAYWRWVAVVVTLLPFVAPRLGQAAPLLRSRWLLILTISVVGPMAFILLNYWGLQRTTAINAAIANGAAPALTVLASLAIVRERVTWATALGMAVAFAGTLAIVARGDPAALLSLAVNHGDIAVVAAVGSWAVYTVLLRYVPPGIDPSVLVFVMMAVSLVLGLPLFLWELSQGLTVAPTLTNIALILYSGAIISVLANMFWIKGIATVGANVAGQFNYLISIFGTFFAVALLGEAFEAYHLAGMTLVMAGVYLATGLRRR